MVMDYQSLKNQTVKNNYPLPLITELINNMGSKKVFTKIDLRWGFNNVRIKEGDKWKGAFTMHISSFKPTVMFFRMTNSPVTFQAMMNEILRDLINEGKVAAFMDDIRATGHKTPGESSVILQLVVMIQLTSRRILRD